MRFGLALLAFAQLRAAGVEFNRDVRPILSDKCYVCHGPDAAAKHVPFRLDSEAAAKADLGGGRHAIVEGNADASELVQRTAASKAGAADASGGVGTYAERGGDRDAARVGE